MKRILLFFICLLFFLFSFSTRYQAVSLELVKPTTKQVEIKGEVSNPGVYTLKYDATVQDLIDQAGGLTDQADTSNISLVRKLTDKEIIVIDEISEEDIQKISINNGTLEELDSLPGIGPSTAQKIIDYRNETPFTSIEQIMEVKGIKEKLFAKIEDYICL